VFVSITTTSIECADDPGRIVIADWSAAAIHVSPFGTNCLFASKCPNSNPRPIPETFIRLADDNALLPKYNPIRRCETLGVNTRSGTVSGGGVIPGGIAGGVTGGVSSDGGGCVPGGRSHSGGEADAISARPGKSKHIANRIYNTRFAVFIIQLLNM